MEWDGQYDGLRESGAFFRPMRIPEQCSGEMLTAELQREFCFQPLDDAFIQNTGSRLLKELRKSQSADAIWLSHFFDVVARYPVQSRQAAKHDIAYVIPFIPSIALFSTPRRVTKRNEGDSSEQDRSWKPGLFIKECLSYSLPSEQLDAFFKEVRAAVMVSDADDLFARFITEKTDAALLDHLDVRIADKLSPDAYRHVRECFMPQTVRNRIAVAPFKRFADDIRAVLSVKPCVSRRQFMAMLESILRIGTSAHVLWMCNINRRLEKDLFALFNGGEGEFTDAQLFDALNMPSSGILSYGINFQSRMKEFFKAYERSTKRLSFLLYRLKEVASLPRETYDWSSPEAFVRSVNAINGYIKANPAFLTEYEADFSRHYLDAIKKYTLKVDCQATHLLRFVQTALSQNNQPSSERYSRYDQSYLLRHRTHSNRSAVIVNAGAVTLMSLVHACSCNNSTVLLSNLVDALMAYGVAIPPGEITETFKMQLRELGLTIDSPDAESGMVLQDIVGTSEEAD